MIPSKYTAFGGPVEDPELSTPRDYAYAGKDAHQKEYLLCYLQHNDMVKLPGLHGPHTQPQRDQYHNRFAMCEGSGCILLSVRLK